MSHVTPDMDVAVIGAGPAGAAIAHRLAGKGCRVLLVERSHFDKPRAGETLAPGVQPLLQQLNVWDRFLALKPIPSWGTRSLWGDAVPLEHSHMMSPYGCGWHVDRRRFDQMLAEAARDAGAGLCLGTTLIGCERSGEHWQLHLQEHITTGQPVMREVRARVLVDATGRAASVARKQGAVRKQFDKLIGVAGWLHNGDTLSQGYTLVESIPHGWWYSVPLAEGQMLTMLMTDRDLLLSSRLYTADHWIRAIGDTVATRERTRHSAWSRGPKRFCAMSQRLQRNEVAVPWLAIGDATLAVDPISGSGVVRAMRSAERGAWAVLRLLSDTSGGQEAITAYETESDQECDIYLKERAEYYGAESRWPDMPFWQRRQGASALLAESLALSVRRQSLHGFAIPV